MTLIILVFAFIFFRSPQKKDFSFLSTQSLGGRGETSLFAFPALGSGLVIELPLSQQSQILTSAPPEVVEGQVLGTLVGEESQRDKIMEYTVKKGDTLSEIASSFEISLETLLWANDLTKNSVIKPGQKLIVLPVSGVLYEVKKGDTLSEIAEVYKGKVSEIVAFNHLASKDDIFVGDVLIVPGGEMPAFLPQAKEVPLAASYFIFPTQGRITQGPHGFSGNAVDIGNECGTPVVAAAGGKVLRAGPIWFGGNRVTILHPNGVVSYYGHLSTILVRPGQSVSTGDLLGYIGNTGFTLGPTGCHLHFALRGARNFLAKYPVGSYLKW